MLPAAPTGETYIPKIAKEFFPIRDNNILAIESMKNLEKFILKKKDTLSIVEIVTILHQMQMLSFTEKWSLRRKTDIQTSIEFHVLLNNLKKHIRSIDSNELVTILTFFINLGISNTSLVVQDITKQLIKNVDQISFQKHMILHNFLVKKNISSELQELGKKNIEDFILNFLQGSSDKDVHKAVYYATLNDFSVDCMVEILKVAFYGELIKFSKKITGK